MMMTDAQREAAARELCRLRGVDPGKRIQRDWYDADGIRRLEPERQWESAAREILVHEQMQAAIAFGLRHPLPPPLSFAKVVERMPEDDGSPD